MVRSQTLLLWRTLRRCSGSMLAHWLLWGGSLVRDVMAHCLEIWWLPGESEVVHCKDAYSKLNWEMWSIVVAH